MRRYQKWYSNVVEKLNPAQEEIKDEQGETQDSTTTRIRSIQYAYKTTEVVNRGVNLVVDAAADINLDVKDKINSVGVISIRPEKLKRLINYQPNDFQDVNVFRRNIVMDYLIEGNAFIYWDGAALYNLPACSTTVIVDKSTFVKQYEYNETIFQPNEIIHIRENAADSIFRGTSRLQSAMSSIEALGNMIDFQSNFFENGTIPTTVLMTDNVLSTRVKNRTMAEWRKRYSVKNGAKRPILLDGGWDIKSLGASTIKDLDFVDSVETHENKILEAIGVPPVLLKSGNNANIAPNLKMFYIDTVLPIVNHMNTAFERFFGYDLKPVTTEVQALKPELKDEANFWSTLKNSGIVTANEAREHFRLEKSNDPTADDLILPANIAGSASDSTQGGAPGGDNE